jgi:hypothetical protein
MLGYAVAALLLSLFKANAVAIETPETAELVGVIVACAPLMLMAVLVVVPSNE